MKNYFLLVLLLLSSCTMDRFDARRLYLRNNTNAEIYCFFSHDDYFSMKDLIYTDSICDDYKIEPKSCKELFYGPPDWMTFIMNSENSKMRLLIIENNTVNRYGWDRIIKENRISKIFRFDIADLDRIKWQVTYDRD